MTISDEKKVSEGREKEEQLSKELETLKAETARLDACLRESRDEYTATQQHLHSTQAMLTAETGAKQQLQQQLTQVHN